MARREDIVNTIWDELDHLSNDAVLLYVWSWTNPRCGMAGVYKVPQRRLLEGRLEDPLPALSELVRDGKLRYEDGVLWNVARVKRLSHISEQIAKSIAKDLAEIDPSNPVYLEFVERYGSHPKLEGHLRVTRGSSEGRENPIAEPIRRGSPEGHPTLPGRGRGSGSGEGPSSSSSSEFDDWLAHYVATTGYKGTRGSKPAREAFSARRREGLTLDELKLATVGCHSDEYNREHHHDVPETILRASKVTRYIKLATGPEGRVGGMAQAERFARMAEEERAKESAA